MKYALESPTERALARARYQGPRPLPAVLLASRGRTPSCNSAARRRSPDGKRLATASAYHAVQIYALDIRDLMALARQRVTTPPSDEDCKRYLDVDKCPPFPELSFW